MPKYLLAVLAALLSFSLPTAAEEAAKPVEMTVYRSPTCGCCGKWLEQFEHSSFNIKNVITDDLQAVKDKYGVPDKLASCHTAVVDGYVVEGHVPADDIRNFLRLKPASLGIAAPGMPLGSPGMEMAGQTQAYRVISFDKDGKFAVFAEHGSQP